jgi:hypothetical protein
MRLAAAYIDRGGPVRAADVATPAEIAGLRETRLVLERERERKGAAVISLQILTGWFAAQALPPSIGPTQASWDNGGTELSFTLARGREVRKAGCSAVTTWGG